MILPTDRRDGQPHRYRAPRQVRRFPLLFPSFPQLTRFPSLRQDLGKLQTRKFKGLKRGGEDDASAAAGSDGEGETVVEGTAPGGGGRQKKRRTSGAASAMEE
jgi:hypothetical protein